MKPDQHKLKKNAVYKKKHGISSEKQLTEINVTIKNCQRASQNPSKNAELELGSRLSKQILTSSSCLSTIESVDEKVSASFARRKIESNWQKYEIDIDAVEDTLRGADYNELLQSTRNVLPHYQFGKSYGVEEEHLLLAGDNNWLEKFVALDCEHLATALLCVPLERRLDIDGSVFEESSLEVFKNDAALHMCAYQEKFGIAVTKSFNDELGEPAVLVLQCNSSALNTNEQHPNSVKKAESVVLTKDLSEEENAIRKLNADPIDVVDEIQIADNCEELDRLIPGVSNEACNTLNDDSDLSKRSCAPVNEKTLEELELELDSLLSV